MIDTRVFAAASVLLRRQTRNSDLHSCYCGGGTAIVIDIRVIAIAHAHEQFTFAQSAAAETQLQSTGVFLLRRGLQTVRHWRNYKKLRAFEKNIETITKTFAHLTQTLMFLQRKECFRSGGAAIAQDFPHLRKQGMILAKLAWIGEKADWKMGRREKMVLCGRLDTSR